MVGRQIEGYPAVPRYVRGHLYYIQWMQAGDSSYVVGEFRRKKKDAYIFTKIADNFHGYSSHTFTVHEIVVRGLRVRGLCVREVFYEDLPLFINAKYTSVYYKRLLAGKPMRLKLKLKPSRKSLAHNK